MIALGFALGIIRADSIAPLEIAANYAGFAATARLHNWPLHLDGRFAPLPQRSFNDLRAAANGFSRLTTDG
jgi:hypothetical protein